MCVFTLVLAAVAPVWASHSPRAVAERVGVKNGAQYAMFMPANWNRRLVVYTHGFVDPAAAIALPDVAPADVAPWVVELRERLLGAGYAVAYSSYAENGWAVRDGHVRTHELWNLFMYRFGVPSRVYVVGRSLGALVGLYLAENFPGYYDGALALCGPVGGGRRQADHIGHTRVLFDFFFPGVIPGDAVNVPELDYRPGSPLVNAIVGAILANPQAAVALAAVDQIELPYTTFEELVNSIVRALGYHVRGTNDLLARTGGLSPFGNLDTVYSGLGDFDAVVNAGVERVQGYTDAIRYLNRNYRPSGNLAIPVLTLHTTLDPDVPFSHQAALAKIVANAWRSNYLVQESVQRYGHCNFSPAEVVQAISRLANWAERGIKPAGSGSTLLGSTQSTIDSTVSTTTSTITSTTNSILSATLGLLF
jgi:pimeloyl-ACP methyl ester carboxylesterase